MKKGIFSVVDVLLRLMSFLTFIGILDILHPWLIKFYIPKVVFHKNKELKKQKLYYIKRRKIKNIFYFSR